MQLVAIIDLGTNTFNLLIVEVSREEHRRVVKTKIPAKLGAGGFADKIIKPDAFQRGLEAMQDLSEVIQAYDVDQVYAFATSAMRDARNSKDFVKKIKEHTGIEINTISGDHEAELIYNGVNRALKIGENPELIMDIGGGSTEFIIANQQEIFWKHSFNLGVSRIFEHLKPQDPLLDSDITQFETYLDNHLISLFDAIEQYKISGLIGSSGSFDSLARMIRKNGGVCNKLNGKTEYLFSLQDLSKLHLKLINSTFKKRTKMKGLVAYRIETIPLASAFINYIINKLSINKVRLSTYALREGVISELAAN